MGSIIELLLGWGVPAKFARPLAYAGLIIALVSMFGVAKCSYDASIIKAHDQKIEAETQKKITAASGNAADQRAKDAILNSKQESEAHNAISSAPETPPSPAAVRLNCLRLQRAGKDTSRYPACR